MAPGADALAGDAPQGLIRIKAAAPGRAQSGSSAAGSALASSPSACPPAGGETAGRRRQASKTITERATAPVFMSVKASLTCESEIRREISSSSFSRPLR